LLANGRRVQSVLSCMLGVVVESYVCEKSVFSSLAFGVLRRFLAGSISVLALKFCVVQVLNFDVMFLFVISGED